MSSQYYHAIRFFCNTEICSYQTATRSLRIDLVPSAGMPLVTYGSHSKAYPNHRTFTFHESGFVSATANKNALVQEVA